MRSGVDGATLALYTSGVFDPHWRLKVANGSGTMINLFGRYTRFGLRLPNPNEPIGSLDVDFIRETTTSNLTTSLSPLVAVSTYNKLNDGVTYSPLLQIGRLITLEVALTAVKGTRPADGSSLWYEVYRGYITNVDWPEWESRNASIKTNGIGGILQHAKSEAEYTYVEGTSFETVAREILDNNGFPAVTISFPVSTGKVLPVDYAPGLQKTVWSQLWDLAQSMGWIVYYRYTGNSALALTFFAPAREKVIPDMTIDADDWRAIGIDETEIRNVGYLLFYDEVGKQQLLGPFENATSMAKYGGIRRPFWIALEEESPIRSEAEATDMLDAAMSDVADPDAIATALTFPTVFAEAGVDLYTFLAMERFFDSNQTFAPFAVTIEVVADQAPIGLLNVRGVPTAGAHTWTRKEITTPLEPPELDLILYEFEEIVELQTDTTRTIGFIRGNDVHTVRLWIVDRELGSNKGWPKPENLEEQGHVPVLIGPPDPYGERETFVINTPLVNREVLVQAEPWSEGFELVGPVAQIKFGGPQGKLPVIQDWRTIQGVYPTADVYFGILDPETGNMGGILEVWVNHDDPASPDPTSPPDAFINVASTPATIGPTTQFNLTVGGQGYPLDGITFQPTKTKTIYARYTSNDDRTTGVVEYTMEDFWNLVDEVGELQAGAIHAALQIAADIRPPGVGDVLPPDGTVYSMWLKTSDNPPALYRWDDATSTWVKNVNAADILGQIGSSQIAAAAIIAGKIAALAVTAGTIATDAVVAGTIAAGAVNATAIQAGAITTVALGANVVTAAKMSVGALSAITADLGSITAGILSNPGGTAKVRLDTGYSLGSPTSYLDLAASGAGAFLKHPNFELRADGKAFFKGQLQVDASMGYGEAGIHMLFDTNISFNAVGHAVANRGVGIVWDETDSGYTHAPNPLYGARLMYSGVNDVLLCDVMNSPDGSTPAFNTVWWAARTDGYLRLPNKDTLPTADLSQSFLIFRVDTATNKVKFSARYGGAWHTAELTLV